MAIDSNGLVPGGGVAPTARVHETRARQAYLFLSCGRGGSLTQWGNRRSLSSSGSRTTFFFSWIFSPFSALRFIFFILDVFGLALVKSDRE